MDFQQARFNMVEQQIRPWDVLNFDLLDALESIPREKFVQKNQQGYAYADTSLALPNGGRMLEPKIVARMIQGLSLTKTDRVLEVGTGSGYATAVLATLARSVRTFDTDGTQQALAKSALQQLEFDNIQYQTGDGLAAQDERYDAIYIGGALREIPEALLQSLNDGGRMVVVVGGSPVQRCLQIIKQGDTFSQKTLFDTQIVYLNEQSVKADLFDF